MKFIALFLIITIGAWSPLIFDIEYLNNYQTPLSWSFFLVSGVILYRMKFKKNNYFKLFLFRNYIKFKRLFGDINQKLKPETDNKQQTPLQMKSIKLWKLLLRDSNSNMSCSLINKIRQIEKDNMLVILSQINEQDYLLTIMDVDTTKSCLYEVPIYSKISTILIDTFDTENQKRMNLRQSVKKESISNDLDKLINEQVKSLIKTLD